MNNTNQEIAKIFRHIAFILEVQGVALNPRAHERAAESLENLNQDVLALYNIGGVKALLEIPAVGKGLADHIEEYIKTKKITEYEKLRKSFPVDIEELSSVEGLGPKKVKELYEKLGVKNLIDLEKAVQQGKVADLERFGQKSEENIKKGIEFLKKSTGRVPL